MLRQYGGRTARKAGNVGPITALIYYRETGSDYYDFGGPKPSGAATPVSGGPFNLNP